MANGRSVGRVVYRTIADELQRRIAAGEWPPGKQMPTESALVAEFGVNRLTVRQALAQLQQVGVVDIRHGSGTFVTNPPPVLEIVVDPETQLVDEGSVHATVKSVTSDVTESVIGYAIDPNRTAAGHIGVPREVTGRLDTLVGSGGDPFAVSSYWLDHRRFGDVSERWILDATLTTVLREVHDVTVYYDWRAFSAVAAGAIEAEHLGAHLGAPLIVRDGVSVDADAVPVYYVRRRIRAERAAYVVRYRH
jgi:DNA-binding GntR family transcriptional regulator